MQDLLIWFVPTMFHSLGEPTENSVDVLRHPEDDPTPTILLIGNSHVPVELAADEQQIVEKLFLVFACHNAQRSLTFRLLCSGPDVRGPPQCFCRATHHVFTGRRCTLVENGNRSAPELQVGDGYSITMGPWVFYHRWVDLVGIAPTTCSLPIHQSR